MAGSLSSAFKSCSLPELNVDSWKTKPFRHQISGVKFLLGIDSARKYKNLAYLADEMGSGKTKQLIDTACILYTYGQVDTVVVVCPSAVKITWDKELDVHCWLDFYVSEYYWKQPKLPKPDPNSGLHFVLTNYEFVRGKDRLRFLHSQLAGRKVLLVFDESSSIKSDSSAQTSAARALRNVSNFAFLSNGSPINNNLLDLYAPFSVLNKGIIGCENIHQYRNRYCVMGGWKRKQIVGYQFVEHLQKLISPYIIRRLKEDCLDLPPKLYNVMEIPLCEETWKRYKEFRDTLVTWLDAQTPILTLHAVVKLVRLAQFCSGMVGGLEASLALAPMLGVPTDELIDLESIPEDGIRVISSEKHNAVVEWFSDRCNEDPHFRAILWTRFRKEQEILEEKMAARGTKVLRIYGGQKSADRETVIREFNTPADRPVVLLGQPRAGGLGLNLQAECSWAVYVSSDYSLLVRQQSEDRIHRAGQKASTVNYLDLLATGPRGQKTIDHAIKKILESKSQLAHTTTSYWRTALLEE